MENPFDRDDFESFLQEHIDSFSLQPKASSWRRIYAHVQLRGRNHALLATFLLIGLFIVLLPFNDGSRSGTTIPLVSAHPLSVDLDEPAAQPFLFDQIFAFIQPSAKKALAARQKQKIAAAISGGKSLPDFLTILQPEPVLEEPGFYWSAPPTEASAEPSYTALRTVKPSSNRKQSTRAYESIEANRLITNNLSPARPMEAYANLDGVEERVKATKAKTLSTLAETAWLKQVAQKEQAFKKKNRLALQFYFSPTISFRELDGRKTKDGITPLAITSNDVNRFVNQSPSLGLEVGSGLVYNLSERLNVKAGVQMNLTRYNIQAFRNPAERSTILLNNNSTLPDTLSAVTTLRSLHGELPETIHNQYLQVSIPVGVEFKILGNKAFQFNIAGTLQPGYMLAYQSYLLTSDYSSYTQQSSLMRRWNVSSNLETYFSYQKNGFRWQIGPQFRYQLLSSYKSHYDVKEYLMEYGIKFGFTRIIR